MLVRLLVAAGAAAALLDGVAQAQVLMERDVSLRMALTIAQTALAQCGDNTTVAVVDRAGRLKAFLPGRSGQPPQHRACTPQGIHRAHVPRALSRMGQAHGNESGQRYLTDVIPLGGGMPINVGTETIGGVGLSGATGGQEQEEACAKAGIAKVADQLK
jgi:uncharacterized protein GlcG (DUF336 family)